MTETYTETRMTPAELIASVMENPSGHDQIMKEAESVEFYDVERIEINNGIFMHCKGHPFPSKGLPNADAIFAINQVKRMIINTIRLLGWRIILLRPSVAIKYFTDTAWTITAPQVVRYEHMTNTAQGVYDFTYTLIQQLINSEETAERLSKILATIIQHDSAYRFRLMDMASEANELNLYFSPIKEIRRLTKLNQKRDYAYQHSKFRLFTKLLILVLHVPKFRKAWRIALENTDWTKLYYDDADAYWAKFKGDYQYMGLTLDERQQLLPQTWRDN